MKFSIIVPVFNEEKTILEVLNRVNKQKTNIHELEVIVIDDGSSDGSKEILLNNENLYTKLILMEENEGKGSAVKKGLNNATGDYVLFQDADLEYNPKEYSKIFEAVEKFSAEIVIGSRFISPEYTRVHYYLHKIGNKFITFLFNILFNTTFTDIYSCYLCFKRDLIDPNKLKNKGWAQQAEILGTAVKKSKIFYEVPISYSGRSFDEGKKIKGRNALQVILMIVKKRLF